MQQINRKDFSTTADGADIFTIAQPGARLKNDATLATAGDLASAIRIAADGVTVTNQGELTTSGNGSFAIVAGDIRVVGDEIQVDRHSNVSVANYGSITTTGGTYFDGTTLVFASGIGLFGDRNLAVNYGTITNLSGDDIGMWSIGAGSTLINHGTIESQFAGIGLDWVEGPQVETGNTVINYGDIHTSWDQSHGISVLTEDNVIRNYGTIVADGFNSFGIAMEAAGNHGENYGTILVTGEVARGVLMLGEGSSFDNHGLVRATGAGSIGVRFSSENPAGSDGGVFTNYGTVEGAGRAVSGADSNDHVVNYGILAGTVSLGAGDDSYLAGHGSSLTGELILGDGNDLVILDRDFGSLTIADFMTGAGSDDLFDVSAFGFHSLDEILAHALQNGDDVLLSLSGHDQVTLLDTSLASFAADDFLFAIDHGAAGALLHGLGAEMAAHPDAVAVA